MPGDSQSTPKCGSHQAVAADGSQKAMVMVTELETTSSEFKGNLCGVNLCLQRRKKKMKKDGSAADTFGPTAKRETC